MLAPDRVAQPSRDSRHGGAIQLDPRAYARGLSCVHCGLCLPACPTYTETGNEADSPRGRIQLMLGLADGRIELTDSVKHHLDLCLDCRGCETACPSGVVYHELIEETRNVFAHVTKPTLGDRAMRWIFLNVLTHPMRLKVVMLPARIMQKIGLYGLLRRSGFFKLLPTKLQKMEQMLPDHGSLWARSLPERITGFQPVRSGHGLETRDTKNVAFLEGCIGSVIFEKVNRQSVELLGACGAEVTVPRAQVCCGAIHHHNGAHEQAQRLARQNIDAFAGSDLVVTNIAGCGAMLREYDVLLRDDPAYSERAKAFVSKVRDISEALLELGLPQPAHALDRTTATYHDACHLAHAQKVTAAPRALLAKIPGLTLAPLPESDMCCGAAGTYNLQHPAMATSLAQRKLDNIASTGAALCVTGNVGCAMHISSQAAARKQPLRVVHPVELLHAAVFGSSYDEPQVNADRRR
jgi:glycolate oxidase iron-sulfur subunit